MGQPLIRLEIVADAERLKVRLAVAPSILTEVYARDGLGLFDRSNANLAVELRDRRDDRRFEPQPALVEVPPGAGAAEGLGSNVRPGRALALGPGRGSSDGCPPWGVGAGAFRGRRTRGAATGRSAGRRGRRVRPATRTARRRTPPPPPDPWCGGRSSPTHWVR